MHPKIRLYFNPQLTVWRWVLGDFSLGDKARNQKRLMLLEEKEKEGNSRKYGKYKKLQ